jgi:hypothetical protein
VGIKDKLRKWGFAEGFYYNNCKTCGETFIGDKRAWNCFACACKKADNGGQVSPCRLLDDSHICRDESFVKGDGFVGMVSIPLDDDHQAVPIDTTGWKPCPFCGSTAMFASRCGGILTIWDDRCKVVVRFSLGLDDIAPTLWNARVKESVE